MRPNWATALWGLAVTSGMAASVAYETSAGPVLDRTPEQWPETLLGSRPSVGPTMVLFLHPKCPCSRSSVAELRRIRAKQKGAVDFLTVLFAPRDGEAFDAREAFAGTEFGDAAHERLLLDPGGDIARACGVSISGTVLAYGADDQLRFAGGVTPGRGHAGQTVAHQALSGDLLALRSSVDVLRTPTFGCELWDLGEEKRDTE